jgi:hypothetical protein
MDTYTAVFNCDETDRDKARRAFNRRFGAGRYKQHIAPIVRKGIMSIFSDAPTEETLFYAETLAAIVNKRIGADSVPVLRGK